ncbi:hypothetical protein E2C01_020160 [Portunus trituberculatus]|uniref:Uncharacterized protein n=1 Tax=Portunus trituberculatus TaxID=210409 RepID=A0A5B7DZT3_PORTR|nr:hypothetical protein [Portunus trituberculatus]
MDLAVTGWFQKAMSHAQGMTEQVPLGTSRDGGGPGRGWEGGAAGRGGCRQDHFLRIRNVS